MEIVRTIRQMRAACARARALHGPGAELGLVPTMGAIHDGHVSLVRAARARCGTVAASIFVNPAQFGPGEDLATYPRTFAADCALLEQEGVDLVFAPAAEEMYPRGGVRTFVEVGGVGDRLDGRSRPGHFRGVATVVAKLFHIVGPDCAFFGQKDAAQVAVLRAMVRDLDFPVELVVEPTVRERDGLAMSSRNRYLSEGERREALALVGALRAVEETVRGGVTDAVVLRGLMAERIEDVPGVRLDYAEIVDMEALEPVADVREGALVAVAAWVGGTRLIDNVVLPAAAVRGGAGEEDR